MRRWNGWGDDGVHAHLGPGARGMLQRLLGPGSPSPDASLESVVAAVPQARLSAHPLLSFDPEARIRHARGQSLPDWIALRAGRLRALPDAVAYPQSTAEVRALLTWATSIGASLVPYGGGTSVVGGVTVRPSARPVLSIDCSGLAGLRALDERSGLATVGAGTSGPALERALGDHGLTLGHEPQSWELSTAGGWVATRSSGQRSLGFGRIEALFAGGTLEAPAGTLEMPPFPASAAGPDLRQLVLGSEGRLGILTDVVLRAVPLPETDVLDAYALPGWEAGMEAVRALAQRRTPLSMVRLSDPDETAASLALADRPSRTRALALYVRARRLPARWSMLLVGATGSRRSTDAARAEARATIRGAHGIAIPGVAEAWRRNRFRTPYLRNALWDAGFATDTLETAATWSSLPALTGAVLAAIRGALVPMQERAHAFAHLSHVYPSGSSLYVTYLFRRSPDPEEAWARWAAVKTAASDAIRANGGTISHHHGVGVDHAPYLEHEKGRLGMSAVRAVARTLDPDGIMNPGVLLADGDETQPEPM